MKILLLLLCFGIYFQEQVYCQDYVNAANKFISYLSKEQKSKALFPFESEERFHFHFYPKDDRKGLMLNDMNDAQKSAAINLIHACLANRSVIKVAQIMSLERILKSQEKRASSDHYRDAGKYFVSIFGIPGDNTIWGWRLEGHHISFNFTARNNRLLSGSPGFLGSNPGIVEEGDLKGLQVLQEEASAGFKLLRSLTDAQVEKTRVDVNAPNEIISFVNRHALEIQPSGIYYNELTTIQQQNLLHLIKIYVNRYTKLLADDLLKEIQNANLDKVTFAWAGNTNAAIGKAYYYRIQGPTFVIEFDNSQNNANHVHSIYRDIKNDFADELLEHYNEEHLK